MQAQGNSTKTVSSGAAQPEVAAYTFRLHLPSDPDCLVRKIPTEAPRVVFVSFSESPHPFFGSVVQAFNNKEVRLLSRRLKRVLVECCNIVKVSRRPD